MPILLLYYIILYSILTIYFKRILFIKSVFVEEILLLFIISHFGKYRDYIYCLYYQWLCAIQS
jgi:hypothetical protein